MLSFGGNDWLGIGAVAGKQGTAVEGCGARPNCLFGSKCEDSKKQFDECVKREQDIRSRNSNTQAALAAKSLDNKSNNQKWIYVIVGVIVVILIVKLIK